MLRLKQSLQVGLTRSIKVRVAYPNNGRVWQLVKIFLSISDAMSVHVLPMVYPTVFYYLLEEAAQSVACLIFLCVLGYLN